MTTLLKFETMQIKVSPWLEEASVPFISQINILQNGLQSRLEAGDDIGLGFGTIQTLYPYAQQNVYTRKLEEQEVEVVRLENEYLKAIFLPSLGGRLWSLYDKVAQRDLLYVNDVIRPSNLAVRNAWVSGGVEWNIGVIGHSPFTCSQLFVGVVEVEGMEVLRMYEYERIRKVTYQMDFFLPEDSKFLMCRMRIVNPNEIEVPMYWWSNMAVPELDGGRLVVEADEAYTNGEGAVYKVQVPVVEGVDITYPKTIPHAVDYFFDIPKAKRKYITQLDESGYGMIQTSTSRLQGRKLFVWGQARGSERWQEYLTNEAGHYIEIQAGLAKTQYGCLHMEPASEWEWLEAYGAIQVDKQLVQGEWQSLRKQVTQTLEEALPEKRLEQLLEETRASIALREAKLIKTGSVFGAIENIRREQEGKGALSENLDFGQVSKENEWVQLMLEGNMGGCEDREMSGSYMKEDYYYKLLQKAVQQKDKDNAYTWYHLGLYELVHQQLGQAINSLKHSRGIKATAFNTYALAIAYSLRGNTEEAIDYCIKAMRLRNDDIGLVKECLSLLLKKEAYEILLKEVEMLPDAIQDNTRIKAYKAFAYAKCGSVDKAEEILRKDEWLEVEDIREGECFTAQLWNIIQEGKKDKEDLPFQLDFKATF